jgi:hypothetical protein
MGGREQSRLRVALCVAPPLSVGPAAGTAAADTKGAGMVSADSDPSTNASETLLSSIATGDRERCYEIDKRAFGLRAPATAGAR